MTRSAARRAASRALEAAGIEDAAAEALALLAGVLGIEAHEVVLAGEGELPQGAQAAYDAAIARRAGGCPRQYILGTAPFFGRDFCVTPNVLIPRPDTEVLVEAALAIAAPMDAPRMADVGTGSGCIAVSLALARPDAEVWALDISPAALCVAGENARRFGANIRLLHSDLLEGAAGPFDLIVSNPPYIAQGEVLPREVVDFEPHLALFAEENGLAMYHALAAQVPQKLSARGALAVEVGWTQGEAVAAIFSEVFQQVDIIRDLQGHQRVVTARCAGRIHVR